MIEKTKLPTEKPEVVVTPEKLDHIRAVTLKLLSGRVAEATVCPSEVARAIVDEDGSSPTVSWRSLMPIVHAAVDELLSKGLVRLSWKGKPLNIRNGPYRIGHSDISCRQD